MLVNSIFIDNLIEVLLGLVVTFNLAAFSVLWSKIKIIEDETNKNTESINMVLNRIFGIEEDSTSGGHLVETEERFDNINNKLDKISSEIEKNKKERKKEHQEVYMLISNMVESLSEEDGIEFTKSDLK